nr:retrovirus-related Pol polyprotein from transposon TNT 1-94 [Tanacetum cinerariifolium]
MVVLVTKGSSETTTKRYMENYKNVSRDIRDQLNVEAEAVQIILTWMDNNIYSIVDACPNACEMWKAIERGKAIVNSPTPIYDQEPSMVADDDEMSKDKEIDKLMALISRSVKKIYKPTNNNLRTSSNTSRANQDNSPRISRGIGYEKQRIGNVVGARETVEQVNWRDDTDDESEDQELKAHYMYMEQIQEVNPDVADDSRPIFDTEPLQKDDDDDDDLANERDLLASLIEKLKCEIDECKNRNKILETSNKVLVDKLTGQIEDFKTKNKSLESSNNHFKEANNELSRTNELMYKDLKKFQAELERHNDVKYASKMEIDCAKAKGDLMSYKMESEKINADLEKFYLCLKKEMVVDLRYFNSLELEVDSLKSQLETQKTQFLNEINRLLREYCYADHMNAILGVYTELDEVTNLQCDYLETLDKCESLEKELSNRVIPTTSVSRPKLKSNQTEDIVMLNNSQGKKQEVEDHRRNVMFFKNKTSVTACNDSLSPKTSNVNFVCATCGNCVLNVKHDMCVLHSCNGVNSRTKMPMVVHISTIEPKRIVNQSIATPLKRTVASEFTNQKSRHTTRKLYEHVTKTCSWWYPKFTPPGYKWKPKSQIGNVNPNGNDLLTGSRGTDLYSITLQDTSSPNPICLMAKATSSQAWLWHRRLSHLNFDTINLLSKNDIVIGLSKLKFVKDHLCSSCELGKAKQKSFQTKTTPSSKRRLHLLHMDLCGPMRVESINGKKYVLVILDDYSRYTWIHFLSSKDETPEVLIDFLMLVQRGLHAQLPASHLLPLVSNTPPAASTTISGHTSLAAAAEKVFRQDFPANPKITPSSQIYKIHRHATPPPAATQLTTAASHHQGSHHEAIIATPYCHRRLHHHIPSSSPTTATPRHHHHQQSHHRRCNTIHSHHPGVPTMAAAAATPAGSPPAVVR